MQMLQISADFVCFRIQVVEPRIGAYEHTWYERHCFKLKWETFAGHCFGCGEWGHFMAECHRHCPSILEAPNEGNCKE